MSDNANLHELIAAAQVYDPGQCYWNRVPDLFDAHRVLLLENDIYIMKSLTLEALAEDQRFTSTGVVLPLKSKGGEASLVRPIAIA